MSEAKPLQQELDYETALALLQRDQKIARKRLAVFVVGGISSIVVILFIIGAKITVFPWISYLLSVSLAVGGLASFVRTSPRLPEEITLRDTRLIGPLLDNLGGALEARRANLKCWLRKLLPLMTEKDADLLTITQKQLLMAELFDGEPYRGEEYRLVVLNALQNVADNQALASVRWLSEAGREHGYPETVCKTAGEILPHLETLISEREKRAGLLLPSSAEMTGETTLLRATLPQAAVTDSAELLRAGTNIKRA